MDTPTRYLQTHPPLGAFLGALVLMMGVIILLQMLTQQDLYFLNKVDLGLDYRAFYGAAEVVRDGGSPYGHPNAEYFVTPPLSAIANIPLSYLPFATARVIVSIMSYAAVVASLLLVHQAITPSPRINGARGRMHGLMLLLIFAVIPMYSYPFHFLFDRGNSDGFTLLLLSAGIFSLAKRTALRDVSAGFFFAAAISFKLYPALVVLPLLALRRWRPLAALFGAMACFVLISPSLWTDWIEWLLQQRIVRFRIDENGSLANTFFYVGGLFNAAAPFKDAAVYAWGAMLFAIFALDFKTRSLAPVNGEATLAGFVLYVPFMLAVPQLVYHYELVCALIALPAICHLWTAAARPFEKGILMLITVGLILTQFHAYAAELLLTRWQGIGRCGVSLSSLACLPQWLPGFGLFLMMAGIIAYKALAFIPAGSGRTWGFPTFPRLG